MWDARRILRELTDADQKKSIFADFWRYADAQSKAIAVVQLAKAMRFRDESIRKLPLEKKAEFLAARANAPEFEELAEVALMQYHTHERNDLLAAFLDGWNIPHENGTIESDDYSPPDADAVRSAMTALEGTFDRRDMLLYLATAGLLMGGKWQEATWPVVDESFQA